MRPRFSLLRSIPLSAILVALACSGGGGGGGGPTTPSNPSVTGVAPAQARVGEQVTIQGTDFGSDASGVTVTFRGEAAEVQSVSDTAIIATVPAIAPGPATISVTVGTRAAGPADFTVAQTPLSIMSVEPNPVRAGEEITIRGAGFLDPVTGLAPANGTVVSMIDADELQELPIQSRSFSEIVVLTPGVAQPGLRGIRVERGDEVATHAGLALHIPRIELALAGKGEVTSNTLNGVATGSEWTYDLALSETAYDPTTGGGEVSGTLNGVWEIQGTFSGEGDLELGGPTTQGQTWSFEGSLTADVQRGLWSVEEATLFARQGGNELRFDYDALISWRTEAILTGTLVIDYGDLVTGNGPLPSATYQYTMYDPLSWEPLGLVNGELAGEWFQGTQPRKHFGTVNGTTTAFYDDVDVEGTGITLMRGFWTPLNSSQEVDIVGLTGGQEVVRQTFPPVDNRGVANPNRYDVVSRTGANEFSGNFRVEPAGDGFTTGFQAGVNWIEEDQARFRDARIDSGF